MLGIFAVISFPPSRLLLTNQTNIILRQCACAYAGYHETLKLSESEGKPPKLGPHVVVAMLILFLLYLCIFLSTIYTLKQKSNNSLVVRLAIYGSVNRFFQACAITGKRGLLRIKHIICLLQKQK